MKHLCLFCEILYIKEEDAIPHLMGHVEKMKIIEQRNKVKNDQPDINQTEQQASVSSPESQKVKAETEEKRGIKRSAPNANTPGIQKLLVTQPTGGLLEPNIGPLDACKSLKGPLDHKVFDLQTVFKLPPKKKWKLTSEDGHCVTIVNGTDENQTVIL